MKPRVILVATPIKNGLTAEFIRGLMPLLENRDPQYRIEFLAVEGVSVNFARNDAVHIAISMGAHDLVMIDDDMGFTGPMFMRLISHTDLDVVAGLYCKRRPGAPDWLVRPMAGAQPDAKSRVEVLSIATGFMKIRVSALIKMQEHFPELEYSNQPQNGKPVTSFELFPMGVLGGRSAVTKLALIDRFVDERLTDVRTWKAEYTAESILEQIEAILTAKHEPGTLLGEDYYFCELARQCGIKIHADYGLPVIPHLGTIPFPILPGMVGINQVEAPPK